MPVVDLVVPYQVCSHARSSFTTKISTVRFLVFQLQNHSRDDSPPETNGQPCMRGRRPLEEGVSDAIY